MKKNFGWIAAIGLFLLSKAKWLLVVLKMGKFATLISMFISLGAYAIFYGWKFAFAIIYLIFVHEMGHLVAARMKKLKTSAAIFIPFLGAAIGMKEKPKDAKTEAFVAYGGPLAGLLSILPAIVLFFATKDPYWGLVIQLGALINLFNLFPVSPLDGGRIVTVLSTKLWFLGLAGIFIFLFVSPDPILVLIFIFGVITWWNRVREGYEIKVKEKEVEVLAEYKREITEIIAALYQWESQYEPVRSYYKGSFVRNTIIRLQNTMPGETKKQHFFPFFHDKEKINEHGSSLKKKKINELISVLANGADVEQLSKLQKKTEDTLLTLSKEMEGLRKYYVTDAKTKWITLICYLLLAFVLAFLLVFGMNILTLFSRSL